VILVDCEEGSFGNFMHCVSEYFCSNVYCSSMFRFCFFILPLGNVQLEFLRKTMSSQMVAMTPVSKFSSF
jgi:hypothetical protein